MFLKRHHTHIHTHTHARKHAHAVSSHFKKIMRQLIKKEVPAARPLEILLRRRIFSAITSSFSLVFVQLSAVKEGALPARMASRLEKTTTQGSLVERKAVKFFNLSSFKFGGTKVF